MVKPAQYMDSRNDNERAVLQLKSRARPESVPSTAGDKVLGGLGELARAASELRVDVGVSEDTAALLSALLVHPGTVFLLFLAALSPSACDHGQRLLRSSDLCMQATRLAGDQGQSGGRGDSRARRRLVCAGNYSLARSHRQTPRCGRGGRLTCLMPLSQISWRAASSSGVWNWSSPICFFCSVPDMLAMVLWV